MGVGVVGHAMGVGVVGYWHHGHAVGVGLCRGVCGSCHGGSSVSWFRGSCHGGLCGGSLASLSCCGCGGSSVSSHAMGVGCPGFYFCGCELIFLGSCGLILVVVVVGCMKWLLTGGGGCNCYLL